MLPNGIHGFSLVQEVKLQPDLLRQLVHGRYQVKLDLCVLQDISTVSIQP